MYLLGWPRRFVELWTFRVATIWLRNATNFGTSQKYAKSRPQKPLIKRFPQKSEVWMYSESFECKRWNETQVSGQITFLTWITGHFQEASPDNHHQFGVTLPPAVNGRYKLPQKDSSKSTAWQSQWQAAGGGATCRALAFAKVSDVFGRQMSHEKP